MKSIKKHKKEKINTQKGVKKGLCPKKKNRENGGRTPKKKKRKIKKYEKKRKF
jgi:hypothetical protein